MEQIRQLDFEELLVEEVDDQSSDEDDVTTYPNGGGASISDEITYDTSLAAMHSYLGEVEDTHNRLAFLDGGAVLNIPIFYLEGVVLFPEAALPLRVIQPNFIAAIDKALTQDEARLILGVVRIYRDPSNGRVKFASTGTTAEIRQYRRLEDGSMNVLTRGQQRFRLKRRWIDVDGAPCGEVQIIEEDLPLRTPRDTVGKLRQLKNIRSPTTIQRSSLNGSDLNHRDDSDAMSDESFENELSPLEKRLHYSALGSTHGYELTSSDEELFDETSHLDNFMGTPPIENVGTSEMRCLKKPGLTRGSISHVYEAQRAFLPNWVYRMYDSYYLAQRAADRWKEIVRAPNMDKLVMKPGLLSFHIASKIPVSESTRQELLDIDGISYRLRREIELLESFDLVRCKTCEALIGRRSDMLVMSSEGPLGAYANPQGFVHEVMTLLKASGLGIKGSPVEEYSWFPGYAWSISVCAACESQMGWLFTATKKGLKPRSFWGIRSSQVGDIV